MFARNPERVTGFIIQKGNAYEEGLKEFWDLFKAFWINPTLVDAYLDLGQLENAIAAVQGETNVALLGPEAAKSIEILTAATNGDDLGRFADVTLLYSFNLAIVHLIGGDELVLENIKREWLEMPANYKFGTVTNAAFMNSVRTHERFKQLVTQLGLVDYWRARVWPDYCLPVGDYDFECGAFE